MLSKSPLKQCHQQQAAMQVVDLPVSARLFTLDTQLTMLQQSDAENMCRANGSRAQPKQAASADLSTWLLQHAKPCYSSAFLLSSIPTCTCMRAHAINVVVQE